MTPELEKILYERYPEFFLQRSWPMAKTNMVWGCATEDGWFSLIDAVANLLTNHARDLGHPVPQAKQVKEKFGELRIYLNAYDEFANGIVLAAETLSKWICELTGRPGKVVLRDGWLQALCPQEAGRYGIKYRALMPHPSAKKYPSILNGSIKVPRGWLRLVDCMLNIICCIDTAPVMIEGISELENSLVVSTTGPVSDFAVGAIAFSRAIALCTNKRTGALHVPDILQNEGAYGGHFS